MGLFSDEHIAGIEIVANILKCCRPQYVSQGRLNQSMTRSEIISIFIIKNTFSKVKWSALLLRQRLLRTMTIKAITYEFLIILRDTLFQARL